MTELSISGKELSKLVKIEKTILPYIIKAMELRKTFGAFVAVEGISFHLIPGECLGLLGPNGAGKTTTIRMIYGFSLMISGSLTVFGLEATKNIYTIKSCIGICQQENNLDPDLSDRENLQVFARYFNIPPKKHLKKLKALYNLSRSIIARKIK